MITIAAEHTDPELAAHMANQYVEALERALNDKAFSLAKKNRLFLEEQLRKTKKALGIAEEARQRFEEKYGIVALQAQAEAAIETIATLQAEIMAKEVQLQVLQRSVTGASQEATLLQEELQGLRSQLAQLRHGTAKQPAVYHRRVKRSLLLMKRLRSSCTMCAWSARRAFQNELFAFLTQQLEQAKIEEAKDETTFQAIGPGYSSEKKFKPKRAASVLLAMVVGVFLGAFTAFFREYLDSTIRSREQIERQIGLPLLATIPPTGSRRSRRGRRQASEVEAGLMLTQPPDAPDVEALRYLYTRLKHCQAEQGIQTVLFTSASSG